jgi:hypothetical protein
MKPGPICWFATAFSVFVSACTVPVSPSNFPTTPSAADPTPPTPPAPPVVRFEGETGTGDGEVRQRSQASGGRTVHLGPGERRSWTFTSDSSPAEYVIAVRYSNGRYGPNEVITLIVDGVQTASFKDRDTGEDTPEGWNTFLTDDGGSSMIRSGTHSVTVQVAGGDGCVEIDVLTFSPR